MGPITPTAAVTSFSPVERAWRWAKSHSDIVSSVGILALNTLVLLAQAVPRVPQRIGYLGQAGLSYIGCMALPWMWGDLDKRMHEVREGFHCRDWLGFSASAVGTINQSSSVTLTIMGAAASILSVVGQRALALAYYSRMVPVAIAGVVVSSVLDLFAYFDAVALRQQLRTLSPLEKGRVTDLCQADPSGLAAPMRRMRSRIARTLTLDNWNKLSSGSKDDQAAWPALYRQTQGQVTYRQNQLGTIAIGHASMAVCKLFPESVVEKVVLWMNSAVYTGNLLYRHSVQDAFNPDLNVR